MISFFFLSVIAWGHCTRYDMSERSYFYSSYFLEDHVRVYTKTRNITTLQKYFYAYYTSCISVLVLLFYLKQDVCKLKNWKNPVLNVRFQMFKQLRIVEVYFHAFLKWYGIYIHQGGIYICICVFSKIRQGLYEYLTFHQAFYIQVNRNKLQHYSKCCYMVFFLTLEKPDLSQLQAKIVFYVTFLLKWDYNHRRKPFS